MYREHLCWIGAMALVAAVAFTGSAPMARAADAEPVPTGSPTPPSEDPQHVPPTGWDWEEILGPSIQKPGTSGWLLADLRHVPLDGWDIIPGPRTVDYAGQGYQVKVISDPGAKSAARVPILFQWPGPETYARASGSGSALTSREIDATDPIAPWLDKVLGPRDSAKAGIQLYEEWAKGAPRPSMSRGVSSGVSYYRLSEGVIVRCVRRPMDKSLWWPAEVQILREANFSLEKIEQLRKSLAAGSMTQRPGLADLATIKEVLDAAPLADALKKAQWYLQGYDLDLNFQKITVKFSERLVDRLPFGLRVTIGPRGSLIQLSGIGLEQLGRGWGNFREDRSEIR